VTLFEFDYFSRVLSLQTSAAILAPDDPALGPFHVMFLLHGYSDNHKTWMRRTSIERYVEGLPLIVVMPETGHGFYLDVEDGLAYGAAIGEELPRLIEGWLPTKGPWCVTGLSMGGYGAFRLALANPTRFASAASHSGALMAGTRRNPALHSVERQFGPSPAGTPKDLVFLAERLKKEERPALRMDCGDEDFLLEDTREFHQRLTRMNYAHRYHEHVGDHNWAYWDSHVQESIAFHRENLLF
jgi:S-formylglutathione hydrolase FrmB